jgi:hypothetical protein
MPSLDQRLGGGLSSSRRHRSASGSIPCRANVPTAISSHCRGEQGLELQVGEPEGG